MSSLADSFVAPLKKLIRRNRDLNMLRSWSETDDRRFEFYRQFIARGDLVFDVGANVGNRAKIFSRLGAKVIAFEPQPYCLGILQEGFATDNAMAIVGKGLGETPGTVILNISDAHTISSMSQDFMAATSKTGRFGEMGWSKQIEVEVTTLDQAIAEYGIPRFVKIDVEGFELSVIRGLSTPVEALSFEFTPECMTTAARSIARLSEIGSYEFQLSLGENLQWVQLAWSNSNSILGMLERVPMTSFGDIYARIQR